ncbi:hypothetical protein EUAN_05310 [Andreesenia angusta]|uniref:Smf/DprA SLOG domain-containing protein n=1 Tax=Andreesenia angusta TaxID=39480 RepID=A0A1S1V9E7_9FIRM|nr:DNA-processing protein DprA [Andreesenia angusta]OHW62747.1 hypothetical protein EUAN_05310 [Andreesenia angusta]
MKERDILIWLNGLAGINNRYMEKLDSEIEDITSLWHMDRAEVEAIEGIGKTLKRSMASCRDIESYREMLENTKKQGIDILTIRDVGYPKSLREIPDAPRVLYIKGELKPEDELAISVVGPRKASQYGLWAAETLARELSVRGITVVSGMALGVDAAAHMAALDSGGRTVAVLGTGVDVVYPSKNRHLYERIIQNGAVISEFPPGTKGLPYRFPQRNRIVSGLSVGTIIVEAGEKSGTLTTAQHCLDQGREVFAVPGNINSVYSKGTNSLIQDGAKLVMDIDDILSEVKDLEGLSLGVRAEEMESLSSLEKRVLGVMVEPMGAELISIALGEPLPDVMGILTVLEIKGKVKRWKGGVFCRVKIIS